MSAASLRLAGFKVVCSVVGVLYVLLGTSMVLRGARDAVASSQSPRRFSDSALGDGLHHGPASLVPPIIDVMVVACFAWLSLRPLPTESASSAV